LTFPDVSAQRTCRPYIWLCLCCVYPNLFEIFLLSTTNDSISKNSKASAKILNFLNKENANFLQKTFLYRHELETKLSQKPPKQVITKIPDWPRRKAVAEFWLCIGQDCLGTHLHCIGIRPDPYCMLCSLCKPMDRNHLGQCTALFNRTKCERYWEARTTIMENWLCSSFYYYFCDYSLSLGLLYLLCNFNILPLLVM
jgi:hypothetical protein